MTTLPDLEPAALAKWLEGEAEHQERIAARYKAASTSRETYARRAETFRAAAALAARSTAPEAGKAVAWRFRHSSSRRWEYSEERPAGPSSDLFEMEPLYTAALASVPAPSGAEPAAVDALAHELGRVYWAAHHDRLDSRVADAMAEAALAFRVPAPQAVPAEDVARQIARTLSGASE